MGQTFNEKCDQSARLGRPLVRLWIATCGVATLASCRSGAPDPPIRTAAADTSERLIVEIPVEVVFREGVRERGELRTTRIEAAPLDQLRISVPSHVPIWTVRKDGSRVRGFVPTEPIRRGPYDWVNCPTFVQLGPDDRWRVSPWVVAGASAQLDSRTGVLIGSENAELTIFSGKRPNWVSPWKDGEAEVSLAIRQVNDRSFQMGPPAVTPPILNQPE